MAQDVVELRVGQFSAVFLTLHSHSLPKIKQALVAKVKNSPSFFQNVFVVLQFTPLLAKIDLVKLKELLAKFQIQIVGVSDWQDNLQKELIIAAGFVPIGRSSQISDILPESRHLPTKVIEQSVEANQVIYAKNSDLIIQGNVEESGEVAADGNIHIYGKLKGRAVAGVNNSTGSIYVQCLEAEFIAVNNRFIYKEQIPPEFWQRAVRISAEKDKLTFHLLY